MPQPHASSSVKIPLFFLVGTLALVAALGFFLKPKAPAQPDEITLFPQPKSLAAFHLTRVAEKNQQSLFSQKDLYQHWTFIFFGFTHCPDLCPTTLTELNQAYQKLHGDYPNVQVVFVSIDPEHEQATELHRYATTFNKNFIGLSGSTAQVKKLEQQFGVSAESDSQIGAKAINHTSSIFLVNPQGQWTAIFPYGLGSKKIQTNFKTVLEATTHV